MKRQRFETLMRFRPFRNWWSRELKKRPCKLIDLATRKDMAHEKRIFLEKPRVGDLFKFLIACEVPDVNLTYDKEKKQYTCELFDLESSMNIIQGGSSVDTAIERATLQFLKIKVP